MYNMIYRTRKKGVRISTPQRTVYLPSGFGPDEIKQVGIFPGMEILDWIIRDHVAEVTVRKECKQLN
jgi:hypothetical protein